MDIVNDRHLRTGETIFAALGLTAFSDFLLFDGQFGLSLVLLGLASALLALVVNRESSKAQLVLGAGVYMLALLPILENISALSICVFLTLSAVGTLIISDQLRVSVSDGVWQLVRFFMILPARSIIDIVRWRKVAKAVGEPVLRFAKFGVWIMPLAIGLVFLALFEDANPVIAALIAKIDLWFLLRLLDIDRLIFWAVMFVLVWPFLRARLPARKVKNTVEIKLEATPQADSGETLQGVLFGPAAILRSLVVFNALFALQSILDFTYLIGGVALPDGMTYASYAHRGAYPLIITALLAAAFVLLALREGSEARDNALIRSLVYAWVAQNVLLVLSSILRLDLYVGIYGLTYWRVAAFIWMGLVAIGLLTIIWRIWAAKTAEWLVGTNLATSAMVLYVSCFVSFASLIAHYNVDLQVRDYHYVTGLGPHVLPAIDRAILLSENSVSEYFEDTYDKRRTQTLAEWRAETAQNFLSNHQQWRTWTLRDWRLKRYLDKNPFVISTAILTAPDTRR